MRFPHCAPLLGRRYIYIIMYSLSTYSGEIKYQELLTCRFWRRISCLFQPFEYTSYSGFYWHCTATQIVTFELWKIQDFLIFSRWNLTFWSSIMYCSGPDKQLKKSKQIHISATIVLKLTQPFTNKNPKITFTKKSKGGFLSEKSPKKCSVLLCSSNWQNINNI